MSTNQIIEALGVTAESLGQTITPAALVMMADDLAGYELAVVLDALRRVRRECRRMTLADIVERMESYDGRPMADEAWMNALTAMDESSTVIWTEETAQAFYIARPALEINDKVGARMAFKAAYDRLVEDARAKKENPKWAASLGFDVEQRRIALENAVHAGKLLPSHAQGLLPPPKGDERIANAVLQIACVNGETVNSDVEKREIARRKIAELKEMLETKLA